MMFLIVSSLIGLVASATCPCNNSPPGEQYTCEQQVSFGQCGQDFMKGYCECACGDCAYVEEPEMTCPCNDTPPSEGYTCAEQVAFGQCGQDWMSGSCECACGVCSYQSASMTEEVTPAPKPKKQNKAKKTKKTKKSKKTAKSQE